MFSSLFSPSIPPATLTFCVGIYTRYSLLVSVYAPRFLLPGRLLPVLKQARRGGGGGDLRGGRFASPWLLWDVVLEKNKLPLCSISILYSVSIIIKERVGSSKWFFGNWRSPLSQKSQKYLLFLNYTPKTSVVNAKHLEDSSSSSRLCKRSWLPSTVI